MTQNETIANTQTPTESPSSSPEDTTAPKEVKKENSKVKWYVLQSFAGKEKKAKKLIMYHLTIKKMIHLIEEIFIPEEEVTIKVRGKERKNMLSYYPGYILMKMELTDEIWHALREINNISGFIGQWGGQTPKVVPQKEVDFIKQQIKDGTKQASLNSTYQIGQNIRIIDGPFSDFVGTIEQLNMEKNFLIVSVNIFGRSVPVELTFDKIRLND